MEQLQTLSIAAIVLAGGQSSRMGEDKALISIDNSPLLHLICTLASKCASPVYVITSWPHKYQHIMPKSCQLIQELPLSGENKLQGPLIAFAQALTHINTEWVLLLACDLPRLNQIELMKWCDFLAHLDTDAIAVLPRNSEGVWECLSGFYRSSCLSLLDRYIDRGGRSFQGWLAEHPVQELPVTDSQLLFNCNTPEDLQHLREGRS